jgi:hypothetical protein
LDGAELLDEDQLSAQGEQAFRDGVNKGLQEVIGGITKAAEKDPAITPFSPAINAAEKYVVDPLFDSLFGGPKPKNNEDNDVDLDEKEQGSLNKWNDFLKNTENSGDKTQIDKYIDDNDSIGDDHDNSAYHESFNDAWRGGAPKR